MQWPGGRAYTQIDTVTQCTTKAGLKHSLNIDECRDRGTKIMETRFSMWSRQHATSVKFMCNPTSIATSVSVGYTLYMVAYMPSSLFFLHIGHRPICWPMTGWIFLLPGGTSVHSICAVHTSIPQAIAEGMHCVQSYMWAVSFPETIT